MQICKQMYNISIVLFPDVQNPFSKSTVMSQQSVSANDAATETQLEETFHWQTVMNYIKDPKLAHEHLNAIVGRHFQVEYEHWLCSMLRKYHADPELLKFKFDIRNDSAELQNAKLHLYHHPNDDAAKQKVQNIIDLESVIYLEIDCRNVSNCRKFFTVQAKTTINDIIDKYCSLLDLPRWRVFSLEYRHYVQDKVNSWTGGSPFHIRTDDSRTLHELGLSKYPFTQKMDVYISIVQD